MELHQSLLLYETQMKNDPGQSSLPHRSRYLKSKRDSLYGSKDEFKDIESSQFERPVSLNGSHLKFIQCVFENGFDLKGLNGTIHFERCHIYGNIFFPQSPYACHVHLVECVFYDTDSLMVKNTSLRVKETNLASLTIEESSRKVELESQIDIVNIYSNSPEVEIKSSEIGELYFDNGFDCSMKILQSKIRFISLENHIKNLVLIEVTDCGYLKIFNSNAHGITIKDNCVISNIEITNPSDDTFRLNIYDVKVGSIELIDFWNENNNVSLHKIDLGQISLHNFKSSASISELHLKRLSVSNVDFEKIDLYNIDWSVGFTLYLDNKKSYLNKNLELRENSRKLKSYFLDRSDQITAARFKRLELNFYFQYLSSRFRKVSISQSEFLDWIILFTNKIFSNFGNSWLIPLIWMLLMHWVLFTILLTQNPSLGYDLCYSKNCEFDLGYYFYTLNPLHRLVDKDGTYVYSTSDFFIRIFSSYFIYYFLRGTRKFS